MATTTVRVSEETRETLRTLAAETGQSMQELLTRAIEEYRAQSIIQVTNEFYEKLREDPVEWAAEEGEQRLLDNTLAGGLEDG